jgi:hypothetical protein
VEIAMTVSGKIIAAGMWLGLLAVTPPASAQSAPEPAVPSQSLSVSAAGRWCVPGCELPVGDDKLQAPDWCDVWITGPSICRRTAEGVTCEDSKQIRPDEKAEIEQAFPSELRISLPDHRYVFNDGRIIRYPIVKPGTSAFRFVNTPLLSCLVLPLQGQVWSCRLAFSFTGQRHLPTCVKINSRKSAERHVECFPGCQIPKNIMLAPTPHNETMPTEAATEGLGRWCNAFSSSFFTTHCEFKHGQPRSLICFGMGPTVGEEINASFCRVIR